MLRGGKKERRQRKSRRQSLAEDDDEDEDEDEDVVVVADEDEIDEDAFEEGEDLDEEADEDDDEDDDDDGEDNVLMYQTKGVPLLKFATDIWEKTPPMTQCYVGSSVAVTFLCFLLNKNRWPEFLHFDWQRILFGFQFWRIATAFLFFGALDPFYPLTMQFVWQHMAQLEKLNYANPEEFLIMLLFGGGMLISLYTFTGISMKFLGHNLATYLVYIWSRVFEGADVNFMDLLTLKAEMLPWFFCLQTFLLEQEVPLADLIGIVVGHFYYYLHHKKVLKAPKVLKDFFHSPQMTKRYARFRNDFE